MSNNKISRLIYNFGNNLITIGRLQGSTDMLDRHENFFVAEIINEITHLPYDTFLIPLLKKLSVSTQSLFFNDVLNVEAWDLEGSYLNSNRKAHSDGYSVQSDTTIILKDSVVLFEFKKPHSAPSQNYLTVEQLGRQVLLARKHMMENEVSNFKIILINNSAPNVHIRKMGQVNPNEIINSYFEKQEDKWLSKPFIKQLIQDLDFNYLEDCFHVITWREFIETSLTTMDEAKDKYEDDGINQLFNNSIASLDWFLERRKLLLG